jgi:hypothetical protein
MTKVERLRAKLVEQGFDLAPAGDFNRLYPGHWQRAAGAWSWFISGVRHPDYGSRMLDVGSQVSVTELLAAPSIIRRRDPSGDVSLFPGDAP